MNASESAQAAEQELGFTIELQQVHDYEFRVRFDLEEAEDLVTDEPPPLGAGAGPNPSRLLAAAVGNCLSASLLFCLRKSRVEGARIRSRVRGNMRRNDRGRLRIEGFDVRIAVAGLSDAERARLERCEGLFEDFCVVTASVRDGVPVRVQVVAEEA